MSTTPTELFPGGPSPLVQPPEGGGAGSQDSSMEPLLRASSNIAVPEQPPYSVEPVPGTNKVQTTTPNVIARPERVAHAVPPLAKGWGIDNVLSINKANQLPHDFGNAGGQAAANSQANLIPLVPYPVLSRMGPEGVSWAAAVALAGLTTVTLRGTYRDLHMTPGWRGIQLQYGSVAVKVVENTTGMIYFFPNGPHTIFAPLFMLREFFDLTISGSAAFPAGATALLTTEEQMPYLF